VHSGQRSLTTIHWVEKGDTTCNKRLTKDVSNFVIPNILKNFKNAIKINSSDVDILNFLQNIIVQD